MATSVALQEPRRVSKVDAFMAQVLTPNDREALRRAMPDHVPFDRFERNLSNALMNEPKLLQCNPREVFREVAKIAALGLLIDSQLGEAYLIASFTGPQARIGYRGLIKLSRQSGDVSKIYAHEVHERDFLDCTLGDDKKLVHKPFDGDDPGEVVSYYAVIKYKDGETDFDPPMRISQIEKHRDKYSDAYKAFKAKKIKSTPWDSAFDEMAKKTVMRRLLKRCPQSPDVARAIRFEEDAEIDRRIALVPPDPTARLTDDSNGEHDPETGEIVESTVKAPNPDATEEWDPEAAVENFETICAAAQDQASLNEAMEEHEAVAGKFSRAHQTRSQNAVEAAMKRIGAQQPSPDEDDPEKAPVLAKLREKAMKGGRVLKLALAGLTKADAEMLSDADHESLKTAAGFADRGGASG